VSRIELVAIALAGACLAAGCGGSDGGGAATRPAPDPTTAPAAGPSLPDAYAEEMAAGAAEIIVDPDATVARDEPTYVQREKHPSGTLSGICRFAGELVRTPPPPKTADLTDGPWAIRDPLEGEVDYYANINIRKPRYYRQSRRTIRPTHVVLMFRGVEAGRRPPLTPTGFMAIHGYLRGLRGNHGNRTNITFAPRGTRVTFFTYEAFPCTFVLSRGGSGEELFRGRVTYKDEGAERKKEVGGGKKIWIASRPDAIQSPILRDLGHYAVATARRPWQFGHLFLVDNPYVEVVGGSFEIRNVPAGRHRVEMIYHPPTARIGFFMSLVGVFLLCFVLVSFSWEWKS